MKLTTAIFIQCVFIFILAQTGFAAGVSINYTYDDLNRLTRVEYGSWSFVEYTYDDLGNRLSQSVTLIDSDNDGIPNSTEDANQNQIVDTGETDPNKIDTDGDGIQDGTEIGLTLADIGTDTDTNIFQPDENASTTTEPLIADTDGDNFSDGEEDTNFNGRVDAGESDPNDENSFNISKGDINADGACDLTDAILVLQVIAGIDPGQNVHKSSDVNGDDKIGIEEAVYVIEKIVGLRE